MPYTYDNAILTIYNYLNITNNDVDIIPNTNGRGFVIKDDNGEKCVIFVSPIGCKKDNRQNWVDTRDSGVNERRVSWNYALSNKLKYFFLCVNSEQERYNEYIFSIENSEEMISSISFRSIADQEGTGTQANIPNSFIPSKKFERFTTDKGFNFAVVHKDNIYSYLTFFDNRSYLDESNNETSSLEINNNPHPSSSGVINGGYNKIFYGAPGCGKSYTVQRSLDNIGVVPENRIRVTFHPEYTNSDFVGQIVPSVEEMFNEETSQVEQIVKYTFNPGPFTKALIRANLTNEPVYLIIEEINRGNAAAIFGDIFQLLDRVKDSTSEACGESEYPINNPNIEDYLNKEFIKLGIGKKVNNVIIPRNLVVLATMNSSDQNVFTLDTAFKRRWLFKQIDNDIVNDVNHSYKHWYIPGTNVTWESFLVKTNEKILDHKLHNQTNEDKRMGKYFVTKDCLCENEDVFNKEYAENFAYKVLEYLWNDVCKIGKEDWFDTNKYRTLEQLITGFLNPETNSSPLSVFNSIQF